MDTKFIELRYNGLAEEECCLSCGKAINYTQIKQGEVCVDLGSGRGTDTLKMAQDAGPEGFAYGIDISDKMLEKAERSAAKLGINNAKFIKSPLEKLPLDTKSVDVIISNCTINHSSDKQSVWNEIYRILKSGGRFFVSDIYSITEVPEKYKNDPQAISECWGGAVTKQEYFNTLQKAGFSQIEIVEESKPYPKGEIEVCSFTIAGTKSSCCCC